MMPNLPCQSARLRLGNASLVIILLAIAFSYIAPVLHFQFEKDDLRFLWWAHQNASTPWEAFTDGPLFAYYNRPVVSLVWWAHTQLAGVSAFGHHALAGAWWAGVLLVLYWLGKKQGAKSYGFMASLFFLSSYVAISPLVWKSWITTVLSLFFQLLALVALLTWLREKRWGAAVLSLFFAACAFFAKESAIPCLPVTALLLTFCTSRHGWLKWLPTVFILILAAVAWKLSPTLSGLAAFSGMNLTANEQWINNAGFFASRLFTSNGFQAILLILLIRSAWRSGRTGMIALGVFALLALGFFAWGRQAGLENFHNRSVSLLVVMHCLWFTQDRYRIAPALGWLTVSFWPLPGLGLLSLPYAGNAAVALSWLMGVLSAPVVLRLVRGCVNHPMLSRRLLNRLIGVGIVVWACLMIAAVQRELHGWVHYADTHYHSPVQILQEKLLYDIAARHQGNNIWIDIGPEANTIETYLAIALPHRFGISPQLSDPPQDAYRLEAYAQKIYAFDPRDEALQVWLRMAEPPPQATLEDPYFAPQRWQITGQHRCERAEGWQADGQIQPANFPISQGNHLLFTLPGEAPAAIKLTGADWQMPQAWHETVLTFWMHTRLWERIENITVTLSAQGKQYRFLARPQPRWPQHEDWRRFIFHLDEAEVQESATSSGGVSLSWQIKTSGIREREPLVLGIDEVKLWQPRP